MKTKTERKVIHMYEKKFENKLNEQLYIHVDRINCEQENFVNKRHHSTLYFVKIHFKTTVVLFSHLYTHTHTHTTHNTHTHSTLYYMYFQVHFFFSIILILLLITTTFKNIIS